MIENVPKAKFYKVRVNHRDGPSYSYGQIEQSGWQIELALGSWND